MSIEHLLNTIALIDPQPPFSLFSLRGWTYLVGDTEFAARMIPTLASTATIATTYNIAHRLTHKRTAAIAAALCAFNPYQLWHAQDLRPYSLWMALSSLSALLTLHITARKQTSYKAWVAYILVTTASMYTFYLECFALFTQNLYYIVLIKTKAKREVSLWLLSQLIITLLLIPWLLYSNLLHSAYQPTGGQPNIPLAIQTLLFGTTLPGTHQAGRPLHAIPAIAILSLALLVTWKQRTRNTALFLTLYSTIPLVLLASLATLTQKGYFTPRYISISSVPLIITTATFITSLVSTKTLASVMRILAQGGIMATLVIVNTISIWNYHFNPQFSKAPDWPQIVATLQAQATESDLIIRNSPDPAFDYYYKGQAKHITLPMSPHETTAEAGWELHKLLAQYDYLWFLPVKSQAWDSQKAVKNWLEGNAQMISDQWIGETRLYQYASWEVKPHQITNKTEITFENLATLVGYRPTPEISSWTPGTTIYLELFWLPDSQTQKDLTVFLHLLGAVHSNDSPLWAQDDHPPQHGRTSTQSWQVGILVRDVYTLTIPTDAPYGQYVITIGFYNPETNRRSTVASNTPQGEPNGAILLTATITPTTQ